MNPRLSSSLEALETRIAPAGIVKLSYVAGVLTLTGDAASNQVSVTGTNGLGAFVTPEGDTLLQVGTGAPFAGTLELRSVLDVKVALGAGDDTFILQSADIARSVAVNLGAGENLAVIDTSTILGSLKITGGSGRDTLDIASNELIVGRDLSVALGGGENSTFSGNGRIEIGGKLTYTGGAGSDTLSLTPTNLSIGGAVSITTGAGLSTVALNAGASVVYGGPIAVIVGAHAEGASRIEITSPGDLTVRGPVNITGSADDENIVIEAGARLTLGGALTVNTGAGTDLLRIEAPDALFVGNVNLKGTNELTAGGYFSESGFFGGSLNYLGGRGTDNFTLEGVSAVSGKTSVNFAGGNGQTFISAGRVGQSTEFTGGLAFKLTGAVTDTIFGPTNDTSLVAISYAFLNGPSSLLLGGGEDTVLLDNIDFNVATTLSLGAGADDLRLETRGLAGVSNLNALLGVNLGVGNDLARYGGNTAADRVVVSVAGTLDGGAGSDAFSYLAQGNVFTKTITVLNVETTT
ncbi:MAG: cya 1 [Chthoniobacter sp.]|nr:cya 1 [Chthoniobacter sp.]